MSTYKDLNEIFAAKKNALSQIELVGRGLSDAQLGFKPMSGGWSINEVLEHLVIVEAPLVRLITTLTDKAESATGPNPPMHTFEVSLEPHLERSRTEKYVTRENYNPKNIQNALASLSALRQVQSELLKLRPRLETVDPTLVRFPHWIFGPLDLAQWLAFVGIHDERHLQQINAIVASPEFKTKV